VVAVDIDPTSAQQTADDNGCIAMTADVSRDEDIKRVIEDTENNIGPIDLFCSNAGVGMGLDEQSPDREWQMSWDINVMSHVYAARHLVPRMTRARRRLLSQYRVRRGFTQPDRSRRIRCQ
jgi:NAD(P)-dependent dehydrogenase (short-subunit alcohol dehydrogenase family)